MNPAATALSLAMSALRFRVTVVVSGLAAGCGSSSSSPPVPATVEAPAPIAVLALDGGPPADARRWLAGDLHMHVSPPDGTRDVDLSAAEIADRAREQGMAFVVLTPHLWSTVWSQKPRRRQYLRRWATLVETARAEQERTGVTLIIGVEYGVAGYGHFSVSGLDLGAIGGAADLLLAARVAGAFIIVNHPYAVPTRIAGIPESRMNLSFRRWTEGRRGFDDVDGVEAWNLPLGMAIPISTPGGATGEARAFAAADRIVREEHRRAGWPAAVLVVLSDHRGGGVASCREYGELVTLAAKIIQMVQ